MNKKFYLNSLSIYFYLIVSLLLIRFLILFIKMNIKKESFTTQYYKKTNSATEDNYEKITDYTYSDVQYHDDINTISKQPQVYGIPSGTTFQTDANGNKYTSLVGNNIRTNFTYYTPGTYDKFGTAKYVPSYEDSVYLSKYSTGLQKSAYER